MASLPKARSALRGRLSTYSIVKELHRAADEGAVNQNNKKCIFKSIKGHWRLQNEADILKKYQDQTPFFRPLLDEIVEPSDPPSIVLKHLDNDLLTESNRKRLSRPEIKQVAKCVLQALHILHKDGLVHTDVKLDNIFVNYGQTQRFSTIQLGDCGGVVSENSDFAKEGHLIGAGYTRSPEATFQLPWGTATDIWSFGNAILSLLYGGDYHLFNPGIQGVKPDDNEYEVTVLKRMYKFFGIFPQSYEDFHDRSTITIVNYINNLGPPEKPFHRVTTREVPPADIKFICGIMKLDPCDRPTTKQLLADKWFTEESEDTRDPLPEKPQAVDA
ncbi:kinase-like domain-containing protein [Dichotomopilus funicola]|uniref:Kinase-like domain-containing protein n=1 Tax=Dichotomopilus funicola TaxID=1934379 RepID=A0AAN6UXQ8_9PEZI|nr:kinase-like domain-containing protein [Dichotomopilus funicola]